MVARSKTAYGELKQNEIYWFDSRSSWSGKQAGETALAKTSPRQLGEPGAMRMVVWQEHARAQPLGDMSSHPFSGLASRFEVPGVNLAKLRTHVCLLAM